MKYLILPILFICSCVNTSYKEYADNGQVKYDFKTYGDFGVSTGAVMGDKARAGGIPFLGSSGSNDYNITQTESGQPSSIEIGDNFKITGTVVHSTGMGIVAKGIVRGVKEVVLGMIGWKGLDTWGSIENTKTLADVDKTASGNGVKINDSNNALEGLKSDNSTKVELEALKFGE
tara:strand:- start:350 stop:874 length:525 start_codon:yes stop_codon:yes gene_type:complete